MLANKLDLGTIVGCSSRSSDLAVRFVHPAFNFRSDALEFVCNAHDHLSSRRQQPFTSQARKQPADETFCRFLPGFSRLVPWPVRYKSSLDAINSLRQANIPVLLKFFTLPPPTLESNQEFLIPRPLAIDIAPFCQLPFELCPFHAVSRTFSSTAVVASLWLFCVIRHDVYKA